MNTPAVQELTVLDEINRLEAELHEARDQLRVATNQRDQACDAYRAIHERLLSVRRLTEFS